MVGVLGLARWAALRYEELLARHGIWMVWNTVLALVPLCLGLMLLTARRRRTLLWWFGVALGVAFLPNAPYVLTDIIHLLADVRVGAGDFEVAFVYVPVFATFFGIGFGAYVATLRLVRNYLAASGWPRPASFSLELGLHALSAVGVFLGRVVRLNSWSVVTEPKEVLRALPDLATPEAVGTVLITIVVLLGGTVILDAIYDGLRLRLGRHLPRHRRVRA